MKTIIKELSLNSIGDVLEGHIEEVIKENNIKISSATKTLTGELLSTIEYTYYKSRLTKMEEFQNGALFLSHIYEYNLEGRLLKEVTSNDTNEIISLKVLDENQNTLTETNYAEDAEVIFTKITVYNDKHQKFKEIEPENYVTKYFYKFDNLIEMQIYENEELTLKENYCYDSNNNEIECEGIDYLLNEKINIKKEYNSVGNLLKQLEWTNEKLTHITTYEYNEKHLITRIENKNLLDEELHLKTFDYIE